MNHPLFPPNLLSRLNHSKCWLTTHSWVPKQPLRWVSSAFLCQILFLSNLRLKVLFEQLPALKKFSGLTYVLLPYQNIFCILPRPSQISLKRHEKYRFAFSLVSSRADLWLLSLANEWIAREVLETHILSVFVRYHSSGNSNQCINKELL